MAVINEKREQLRMINQWREELLTLDEEQVSFIRQQFLVRTGSLFNTTGELTIKKQLKKYGYQKVVEAIDLAIDKYWDKSARTSEDWEITFKRVGGILYLNTQPEEKKKMSYIKGIARNRFGYFNEFKAAMIIEQYFTFYSDYDWIEKFTKRAKNWSEWYYSLTDLIDEKETEKGENW
jgi:hypothetical protein